MIRPELDALLQGALDNTLTPDERDRLGRLMTESPEARARAAQLGQLNGLLDSLGPADAPVGLVHDVLAQISTQPYSIHVSAQRRGTPVNKKILIGLAAAAAVVLAVITYSTNPPATEGTEATIGAAQRAQAPQIAAKDVALGDTSAQDVLQTEMWDQLAKDEDLRNMLNDASMREQFANVEMRQALVDDNMLKALQAPHVKQLLNDRAIVRQLDSTEAAKKFDDVSLRLLVANRNMANALKNSAVRAYLLNPKAVRAMLRPEFRAFLQSRNVEAQLRSELFARRMARAARQQ